MRLVAGDYLYVNAFDDVNGWDLQHASIETKLLASLMGGATQEAPSFE